MWGGAELAGVVLRTVVTFVIRLLHMTICINSLIKRCRAGRLRFFCARPWPLEPRPLARFLLKASCCMSRATKISKILVPGAILPATKISEI